MYCENEKRACNQTCLWVLRRSSRCTCPHRHRSQCYLGQVQIRTSFFRNRIVNCNALKESKTPTSQSPISSKWTQSHTSEESHGTTRMCFSTQKSIITPLIMSPMQLVLRVMPDSMTPTIQDLIWSSPLFLVWVLSSELCFWDNMEISMCRNLLLRKSLMPTTSNSWSKRDSGPKHKDCKNCKPMFSDQTRQSG